MGIDRGDLAESSCVKNGLVAVTCHDQLPAGFDGSENGSDKAAAGAVDQKIGVIGAVEGSVFLLGPHDDVFRLKEVVSAGNLRDVAVCDVIEEIAVAVAAENVGAFVSRHVE